MTKTTTAVAIGTMVTVAVRVMTSYNSSTAQNANAEIRRRTRKSAKDTAEVPSGKVTAAATTTTTIAGAHTTVATAVVRLGTNINFPTVKRASAWTRLKKLDQTRKLMQASRMTSTCRHT